MTYVNPTYKCDECGEKHHDIIKATNCCNPNAFYDDNSDEIEELLQEHREEFADEVISAISVFRGGIITIDLRDIVDEIINSVKC